MIDDLKKEIESIKNCSQEEDADEKPDKKLLDSCIDDSTQDCKTDVLCSKLDAADSSCFSSTMDEHAQDSNNSCSMLSSIKNEIKTEMSETTVTMDKFDMLKNEGSVKHNTNVSSLRNIKRDVSWLNACNAVAANSSAETEDVEPKMKPTNFNGMVKQEERVTEFAKKDFENDFDIESEITSSVIMKKQETKEAEKLQKNNQVNELEYAENRADNNVQQQQQPQSACMYAQQTKPCSAQGNMYEQQTEQTNAAAVSSLVGLNNAAAVHSEDWLCLEKELNLISNNHHVDQHCGSSNKLGQKSLDLFEQHAQIEPQNNVHHMNVDLFPNGCINKHDQSPNTSGSSCSQQLQQPSVVHANSISDFFASNDSADAAVCQKSVENRLESMFGESPVNGNGSDSRDMESGLDEIFGNSKSPQMVANDAAGLKQKRMWEHDLAQANFANGSINANQGGLIFENAATEHYNSTAAAAVVPQQHHQIQLSCNNNPRWMQNMEAQFNDFMSSSTSNADATNANRKRHWNGQMLHHHADNANAVPEMEDDESNNKKICNSSCSTSASSPQEQQTQPTAVNSHHNIMDADLLGLSEGIAANSNGSAGFTQMLMQQHQSVSFSSHHQQFSEGILEESAFSIQQQQQQLLMHHQMGQHGNHNNASNHQHHAHHHQHHHQLQGNGPEFDDDISRHVQNAIDSILNLQNSESDSLNFSLDHSMGSFLGDPIGDALPACQETAKRQRLLNNHAQIQAQQQQQHHQHLVDDLGDCLISGNAQAAENASNFLLNHHQQQQQQHHLGNNQQTTSTHHNNLHQQQQQQQQSSQNSMLNDFSCVSSGLDEAVKSIMTS